MFRFKNVCQSSQTSVTDKMLNPSLKKKIILYQWLSISVGASLRVWPPQKLSRERLKAIYRAHYEVLWTGQAGVVAVQGQVVGPSYEHVHTMRLGGVTRVPHVDAGQVALAVFPCPVIIQHNIRPVFKSWTEEGDGELLEQ